MREHRYSLTNRPTLRAHRPYVQTPRRLCLTVTRGRTRQTPLMSAAERYWQHGVVLAAVIVVVLLGVAGEMGMLRS